MATLFETENDVIALQEAKARQNANADNPRMGYDPINDIRSQVRANRSYNMRRGGNLLGAGIDKSGLLGDSVTLNPEVKRASDINSIKDRVSSQHKFGTPDFFKSAATELAAAGYTQEALSAIDTGLTFSQKQATVDKTKADAATTTTKSIYGTLDPSDYTQESRKVFKKTRDYSDLIQYEEPVENDVSTYQSIEYNKYLESLRKLDKEDGGKRYERALTAKRADKLVDTGTGFASISQATKTSKDIVNEDGETLVKEVPLEDTPAYKAQVKQAELEVERIAKVTAAQPKTKQRLASLNNQWAETLSRIELAKTKITPWTTGFGGYLASFPASDARSLKNDLDTIRANIGFDKLQDMRDNSPTGGALGQVSEMENRLLQAVDGALDQLADGKDISDNLEKIAIGLQTLRSETNENFVLAYPLAEGVGKPSGDLNKNQATFDPNAPSEVVY